MKIKTEDTFVGSLQLTPPFPPSFSTCDSASRSTFRIGSTSTPTCPRPSVTTAVPCSGASSNRDSSVKVSLHTNSLPFFIYCFPLFILFLLLFNSLTGPFLFRLLLYFLVLSLLMDLNFFGLNFFIFVFLCLVLLRCGLPFVYSVFLIFRQQ